MTPPLVKLRRQQRRRHICTLAILMNSHLGSCFTSLPRSLTSTGLKPNGTSLGHLQLSSAKLERPDISPTDVTDVSITVPRFYPGDVTDGVYPSPLHSIHVEAVLTADEAEVCLKLANAYAAETGRWEQPDRDRHQTYATCDFAIENCESLGAYLEEIRFDDRMWNRMNALYGVDTEDMTYLDFFCASYQARDQNGQTRTMDRLEAHRDGSLLSFTIVLTPPSEFQGGGTFFDALRDVEPPSKKEAAVLHPNGVIRPLRAGDGVIHSGKLLHGADVVTSGQRTVLVGFVDVADWWQRRDVISEACRDFGRMDVAAYRYKRQQAMTDSGNKKGWNISNSRWLPDTNDELGMGRSHIRGFCPVFPSVAARADPEYQRRKKLEAEDVLLRTLLLPEKEESLGTFFDGDFTIL